MRPAQLRCLSGITGRLFAPRSAAPRACYITKWHSSRGLTTTPNPSPDVVPLRKHLKDEAKRKKAEAKASNGGNKKQKTDPRLEKWELTVGIEVH
jgi:aspartyl-tRNA(Asn)/glutamyl-tRNA(Gln) amidotransferase subunit B